MNRAALIAELTRDEGIKPFVYDDATGKLIVKGSLVAGHPTIGVGRALDVNGISQGEALYLLDNDIDRVLNELTARVPCFAALDPVRQRVLANMGFNLGIAGLLDFHETLGFIAAGKFALAAHAMGDSAWAKQTGARAARLIATMRTGEVQA